MAIQPAAVIFQSLSAKQREEILSINHHPISKDPRPFLFSGEEKLQFSPHIREIMRLH